MIVKDLREIKEFKEIIEGGSEREVESVYCCDLLSIAMGKAPAGCAWCTVMANMNTLAVASLADVGCVILCSGVKCDEGMILKAKSEGIALFETELPIFEAGLLIHEKLNG